MQAYLARSGGRYPRQNTDDREEKFLGGFVNRQRCARRGQSKGRMTSDRAAKLEELPGWKWCTRKTVRLVSPALPAPCY